MILFTVVVENPGPQAKQIGLGPGEQDAQFAGHCLQTPLDKVDPSLHCRHTD